MSRLHRSPALAVLCALGAVGCGSMNPSMAYHSSMVVDRIPARVAVKVEVSPPAPLLDEDFESELEPGDEKIMAQSLQLALEQDLEINGPFNVDRTEPELVLEVKIAASAFGDTTAWMSLPPYTWVLLGVPTYSRKIAVSAQARLVHPTAGLIAEAFARADCTKFSGIYYGYSVSFECAVEDVAEELREKLADQNETILAKLQAAPKGTATVLASAAMPAVPPGGGQVVAVFDLEDSGKLVPEGAALQITDYLATRIAERLSFRVVPRDQLRARLVEEKAEGYKSCFDTSCQLELGKALAAEKSLATRLLRVGKTCAMTTTLYDLRTETAERAASVKTDCTEDGLLSGVDEVVEQLRTR